MTTTFRRRWGSLLLASIAASSGLGAHASTEDIVLTGRVTAGQPAALAVPGVSESVALCGEPREADGIDGTWVRLPDGTEGRAARLDFTSSGDADLYALFYDASCVWVPGGGMTEGGVNRPEIGWVPDRARYAIVNAIEGTGIDFRLTIFRSKPRVFPPADAARPVSRIEPFAVPADDGVVLRGHVYIPEGSAPLATVLDMSPYWNWANGASDGQHTTQNGVRVMLRGPHRPLFDAGFAVAFVNLRGSGLSDGCITWGTKRDVDDIRTVVEGLASQPWSNGSVGMYGISYAGWTAFMGAASHAPSLKAIVPVDGVIDQWNVATLRGAPQVPQYVPIWRAIGSASAVLSGGDPASATRSECTDPVGDASWWPPVWNGDRDDFYRSVDHRESIRTSRVAVFATNGLVPPAGALAGGDPQILQVEGLWDLLNGDKRLLIGQWWHEYPTRVRPDFHSMAVAWFDHYLRGGPQIVEPGIVEYQDDDESWHSSTQWPPVPPTRTFTLSGERMVERARGIGRSTRSFVGVGAPCLRFCGYDSVNGSVAHHWRGVDACIPNNVAYTSPRLREDIVMAGNFRLDLRLSSTLPDGHLFAYLIESDTGSCPDRNGRIIARAVTDLRHIRTEAGEDFPTDVPTDVSVLSFPFAATARAGKRLVLAIGGDGRETMLMPDHWRPAVTVHAGRGVPSALHLPETA